MKKKLIYTCALALIFACAALCACSGNETPPPCATHVDDNENLTCDKCGATLEPPHNVCVDEDKNLICDVCQKSVPCTHADENNDSICDIDACGWDYDHTHEYSEEWTHDTTCHWHEITCSHSIEPSKIAHTDGDNNGICDGCGWDYDHTHKYADEYTSNDTHHWYAPACGHNIEDSGKDVHKDEDKDGKCDKCSYQICKEHTFDTSVWEGNALYHWHPSTCGCKFVGDFTEHTDVDGTLTCDMCGAFYEDPNPEEPEYDGPIINTPPHYIGGNKPKDEENP
jgi:hypothetical protein